MERVAIKSRKTGDHFDTTGTITESVQRNNRTIVKVRIDSGEEGVKFEEGVLFSHPDGKIWIQYPNGQWKRFVFIDTVNDPETYFPRDTPMTDAEIDEAITQEIESLQRAEVEMLKRFKLQHDTAVRTYVKHGNDKNAKETITRNIDRLWPTLDKELTVYRGQLNAQEIKTSPAPPRYFFSTSTEVGVSLNESFFSLKDKCCLFILHIQPGVKYFEVTGELSAGMGENEILIEGNGTFYQDKGRTRQGFRQLTLQEVLSENYDEAIGRILFPDESQSPKKVGVFEAYYFPPTREGGRRKRRRTYRNRRRHTRKRRISG